MRLRLLRQDWQERARPVYGAPEIDVEQPLHLRLFDLVELAEQGDAGIVDDDVELGMRRAGSSREFRNLLGLADIDAVGADLALVRLRDLGGDRLQAGLV